MPALPGLRRFNATMQLESFAIARSLTSHAPVLLIAPLLLLCLTQILAEQVGPWDLDALKNDVPAMKWLRQDQPVHSLIYAGENYKGHPTEVFAFYASPITLGEAKPGAKFPGVVLIHGGGGTAFADWAYLWAKRGYAAIAMDLAGARPPRSGVRSEDRRTRAAINPIPKSRTRLPNGGPDQGHPEKFDSIGGEVRRTVAVPCRRRA